MKNRGTRETASKMAIRAWMSNRDGANPRSIMAIAIRMLATAAMATNPGSQRNWRWRTTQ